MDQMEQQYQFQHVTNKSEYTIKLLINHSLEMKLSEKHGLMEWHSIFTPQNIQDITTKTGHPIEFSQFVEIVVKSMSQRDIACYIDILTYQDLQNMRNKKNNTTNHSKLNNPTKANKRYIILTYMLNESRYHYPLSMEPKQLQLATQQLKSIYEKLRVELEAARTNMLNETSKTEQAGTFSINYDKKNSKNNSHKMKEVDQLRSQNEILKAKLQRLEEQVQKKKANFQIEAAILRTKQLKEKLQTANLELVDWNNDIQQQEDTLSDLRKQMLKLHKKICGLLSTQKQLTAKKKGEEVQKELNHNKNHIKKNTQELDKLKKQLENTKNKVKQLEVKAKKLNSEKQVIKRGKKGPYSSVGSVRSYGTYSSKRSYGVQSNSSKGRSNYSYNSFKNR